MSIERNYFRDALVGAKSDNTFKKLLKEFNRETVIQNKVIKGWYRA